MSNDSVDVGKTIGKYTVYFDSSRKTDRFRTYPQDGPVRFISYPTSAIIAKANGSEHEIKGTVFSKCIANATGPRQIVQPVHLG